MVKIAYLIIAANSMVQVPADACEALATQTKATSYCIYAETDNPVIDSQVIINQQYTVEQAGSDEPDDGEGNIESTGTK